MLKSRSRRRKNRSFQPEACEVLEDRKLLSATDINDQFSEAIDGGAMTVAKSGTGAIDFVTDVDMYKFTVEAGQTVEFEVVGSGGLKPRMRLFGHLISNSHPPQELVSTTSTFSHTFTKAGTYYLGISEDANAFYSGETGNGDQSGPFSKTGDFALTLTPDSIGGSDDDDQISEATGFGKVNAKGRTHSGSIDNLQDVDMFKFRAKANHRVRFDINDTTGGLDTRLRLFNKKGKEIKWNDDSAGSNDSYFEHTFKRGKTFYVSVSASGNNSFNAVSGSDDKDGNSTGSVDRVIG